MYSFYEPEHQPSTNNTTVEVDDSKVDDAQKKAMEIAQHQEEVRELMTATAASKVPSTADR